MSANETTIMDEDGDYSDWFELFNQNENPVNLKGCYISDDVNVLLKWEFPPLQLEPYSFLLVFASEKDRNGGPFLHTNFKIDSDGDYLILSDSAGNILDMVWPVEIEDDISFGRKPDGTEQWCMIDYPSPGATNDLSNSIHLSKAPGFYSEPFWLKIESANLNDQVYFTLDGSIPTQDSPLLIDSVYMGFRNDLPNYFSEIPTTPDSGWVEFNWQSPDGLVDKANIIRIRSYNDTVATSKIYSETYFVDTAIFGKYPYPVISLITESSNLFDNDTGIYVPGIYWDSLNPWWTGNYYQSGIEWERNIHIEYFENDGTFGFAQDAGTRIHGKQTRRRPQKTLRFYARAEYGEKLFHYQLLPQKEEDEYDNFLLTTTYRCWHNTIFKDPLAHEIAKNTGIDVMDYRPVVVFINGEYWGIQTIRDYLDEDYLAIKYDIPESSIDMLSGKNDVIYGSSAEYDELFEFIEENELTDPANYSYVASKIDIANFINYEICEIFLNNFDWPASNIKFWKSTALDNKWRWLFFDIDGGFGTYTYNMMEHATLEGGTSYPNPDWSTLFLRKLLKNDTFKNLFTQRFAELLNTTFQTDSILPRIEQFTSLYNLEIDRHIPRWHFPKDKEYWYASINWALVGFAINRPCAIRDQIMETLSLDEFGFSCDSSVSPDINKSNQIILDIAPNPNDGNFTLHFSEYVAGEISITMYNDFGELIYQESRTLENPGDDLALHIENLSSGIYLMSIGFRGRMEINKIIIAK